MTVDALVRPPVLSSNRLLGSLAGADIERLGARFTRRHFGPQARLYEAGAPFSEVFFVESGMASITIATPAGETIEVAATGREGFVGVAAVLGFDTAPADVCFQIPGDALAIDAGEVRREVDAHRPLGSAVMRYVRARYVQMAQTILCNRRHTIEQRLARWLLMAQDYSGLERFPLTQELMSHMLGVHRPAVTVVAGQLQDARLIEYRRGIVCVRDRAGLERVACACYQTVRAHFDALLPPAVAA